MCAIFGSYSKSMFEVLHTCNVERGIWAGGALAAKFDKPSPDIIRWENSTNIERRLTPFDADVYLGHLQAPTGATRKWSELTTHPFVVGDWIVAHNGVITNQSILEKTFNGNTKVAVDSMLIPIIINHLVEDKQQDIIKSIEATLSLIEGTFSVWIFNSKTKNIYIARQGSNLFADNSGNFSSINGKNKWKEVAEGTLFGLSTTGLHAIGKFKNTTPFFTI
jgi:predicted glutamine amidotransferase